VNSCGGCSALECSALECSVVTSDVASAVQQSDCTVVLVGNAILGKYAVRLADRIRAKMG
jgi:hypothetical protein